MITTNYCPNNRPYELVVFDVRVPGAVERLLSERVAWRGDATVELLGPDHAALIIHAGGAARKTERRAA